MVIKVEIISEIVQIPKVSRNELDFVGLAPMKVGPAKNAGNIRTEPVGKKVFKFIMGFRNFYSIKSINSFEWNL